MAVLTKDTNIHFKNEDDKQRILSILKSSEKPSTDIDSIKLLKVV